MLLKEQVELIRKGHHFLLIIANRNYLLEKSTILGDGTVFQDNPPTSFPTDSYCGYYNGLQFFKQNGLPITVTATGHGYDQWENQWRDQTRKHRGPRPGPGTGRSL